LLAAFNTTRWYINRSGLAFWITLYAMPQQQQPASTISSQFRCPI